jgi:type IX secretion system PorP/SprF family membrane protein
MKKHSYSFLILICFSFSFRAQDVHFSQVFETPVFLSPANTGFYNGYFRAIANYRNQWAAMTNAYQTMAVSIDGGLFKSKKRPAFMGIGLTIFNDRAGVAKVGKTVALLNVSGLLRMGKHSAMSVGLAGGTSATNGNYNSLSYESQFNGNYIDPYRVSGEIPYRQFTTVDVAAGIAYEFTRFARDPDHDDITTFKISYGVFHLNRPVEEYGAGSSYRLPMRHVASVTGVFDLEDTKFTLAPAVVYQQQGKFNEVILGTYMKYRTATGTKVTGEKTQNAFGIGLFYRRLDALIPKIVYDMGDFTFAMAYDINLSGYRTVSKGFGGFEISLRYNDLASALFQARKEYK